MIRSQQWNTILAYRMNRRKFIKTSAGLVAIPFIAGLYTWQVEPFWLEFVHLPMKVGNLPEHLIGKTLMQISDVHVGDHFPRTYLCKSFKKAQELQPDIVVYTGDYVSFDDERQFDQVRDVFSERVQGKLGTYGILGNHDYGHNWNEAKVADEIVTILEEKSIKILRNDFVSVEGLNLIGLDDKWGPNYDPAPIISQVNIDEANIVLCHNPDAADDDIWLNYNSWILAGHTHGGQVKPPFLQPPMLPVKNKRYTSGLIELGAGRLMYINRALGHLHQVRLNVRPEITVFTLQKL